MKKQIHFFLLHFFKIHIILFLFPICFFFNGCSNIGQETQQPVHSTINQYQSIQGQWIVTDDGYYTLNNHYVYYSSNGEEWYPLCSNIECNHNDEHCNSFVGLSTKIFLYNNQIYYQPDSSDTFHLYCMNLDGSNHRKVKEISFGTIDLSQGYGYSWSMNGNYLLVEVSRYEENAKYNGIYYCSLNDTTSKATCVVEGNTTAIPYMAKIVHDSIVMFSKKEGGETVLLYDIKSGKQVESTSFVTGFEGGGFAIKNDILYLFSSDIGFYQMDIHTGELTIEKEAQNRVELGVVFYDDTYAYLCNSTNTYVDSLNLVENSMRGLRIYDYDGNLLDTISYDSITGHPTFAFSTEDKVFFTNGDDITNVFPSYYIEKKYIGTNNLILHNINQ